MIKFEVLATFYLTYIFTQTGGMYGFFDKLRAKYFDKNKSWLGGILNCYWCASPYFAIAVLGLSNPTQFIESPLTMIANSLSNAALASLGVWAILLIENTVLSWFQYLAASLQADLREDLQSVQSVEQKN
jgi:hypothetical protein